MNKFRKIRVLGLALLSTLLLSSCGGGGGVLGSIFSVAATSLTGLAIDSALPINTTIYVTNGAPYGQSGATSLGTLTVTGSNGSYTGTVTMSNSGAPVFATAYFSSNTNVPNMVLTSYLGTDTSLTGTLSSTTLHELDITPVTTAAVAVYNTINNNYNLTPAAYATLVQTYNTDILAIAAGVKSVGDTSCLPVLPTGYTISTASGTSNNLAAMIATYVNGQAAFSSTASASVTVGQVGTFLGAACAANMNSVQTQIQASNIFGPQLLHESTETSLITAATTTPITSGSFTLSGIISETGVSSTGSYITGTINPAALVNDTTVSISSSGAISSTDGNVSGSLTGNQLTLSVINNSITYTLTGRIGVDTQATGTAFVVQAAGASSATTPVLTNFNGVLWGSSASPLWNTLGYAGFTSGASMGGISCGAGTFPLRLSTSGILPLSVVAECVTPAVGSVTSSTSPVWTMAAPVTSVTTGVVSYRLEGNEYVVGIPSANTVNPAAMTTGNWSEVSAGNPFALQASATYTNSSTSPTTSIAGTVYYMAGTSNLVFVATTAPATCSGGTGTCNLTPNGLLTLGNNELHATGVVSSGHYMGLGEGMGR